jgi:hypothetical protein
MGPATWNLTSFKGRRQQVIIIWAVAPRASAAGAIRQAGEAKYEVTDVAGQPRSLPAPGTGTGGHHCPRLLVKFWVQFARGALSVNRQGACSQLETLDSRNNGATKANLGELSAACPQLKVQVEAY